MWSSLASALNVSLHAGQEETVPLCDRLRRAGVLGSVMSETAVRTLHQAVQVLTGLLGPEQDGARGRGELAAMATGSAHGLDDGT
ncbi:TIGR02679 domain-containing protein [Streptomyces marincola]|uniref:TIGR02679 domain-containing protein n=1 Tax=Streptomyces marincola TaxID=2878388 RepID=UPI0021002143|nr:TIGR02679 domain-containing protein [Streptomyces marincola]